MAWVTETEFRDLKDSDPTWVRIDEHTGRRVPVITNAPPPSLLEKIKDYLGIGVKAKTTPLDIEAVRTGKRPFDIRQEVFGTGATEELRRVIARGTSGLTGGLTDVFDKYDTEPETTIGAFAGAGAELAGFLFGPLKGAKAITGTRLAPTASGLAGVSQVLIQAGANLGIASGLSAIIPSLMQSNSFAEAAHNIAEGAAIGGVIGTIYPAMGVVPTKSLRIAATLAVMDKIRAGPGQWFTVDDVVMGLKDGTIDKRDLAKATFGYLMDMYFASKVPSMRKQLAALDNVMVQQIARTNAQEAERTLIVLGEQNVIKDGATPKEIIRQFGSTSNFAKTYDRQAVQRGSIPAGKEPELVKPLSPEARAVESMYNKADAELDALRSTSLKKIKQRLAYEIVDVSAEVKKQLLAQGGIEGKEAVVRHDLIRGAPARAEHAYRAAEKEIYDGLSKTESKLLDRVIQSRRTITIDSNRDAVIRMQEASRRNEVEQFVLAKVREAKPSDKQLAEVRRSVLQNLKTEERATEASVRERASREIAIRQKNEAEQAINKARREGGEAAVTRITHEIARRQRVEAKKFIDGAVSRALKTPAEKEKIVADAIKKATPAERELQEIRDRAIKQISAEQRARGGAERVLHPDNLGKAEHEKYLESVDAPTLKKLNERADKFFDVTRQQLMELRNAGLISEREFVDLKVSGDYSPRRFLHHIDPDRYYGFEGRVISVPDSGLKRLDTGSTGVLENNSRLLLQEVVQRTQARIMRNDANKALLNMARNVPEQGVVRVIDQKNPIRANEEIIRVVEDGKTVEMAMPRELAKQWIETDSGMSAQVAEMWGWLTGAKVLKTMATGANPEFAVTNFPRDLGHIWITTNEYSPMLPVASKQMNSDIRAVAADAILKRGAYVDYINEGGGMSFLTHQGRPLTSAEGTLRQVQEIAGWAGEFSEIITRLALRHRAILNGKQPHEATWIARNYLDFSQGGRFIKNADKAIPYLNATIQGTRGLFRAAKDNPKLFTLKMAQVGLVAQGLFLANRLINDEAWKAIPDRDKVNNFIITTGLSVTDEDGNKRWLNIYIPKDHSQQLVGTLFENIAAKAIGDPVDVEQVSLAAERMIPVGPGEILPPIPEAILSYYANKDFWRNEDIWKGPNVNPWEEYRLPTSSRPGTNPLLRDVGQLSGLSPERLKVALQQVFTQGNIWTDMVRWPITEIYESLGEPERELLTREMLREAPGVRRFLRLTDPYIPFEDSIKNAKIADNTDKFVRERSLDQKADAFYKAKKENNAEGMEKARVDVIEFIKEQPLVLREGLLRRFQYAGHITELKDRRYFLSLSNMSPEARATQFFARWMQTEGEEAKKELMEQATKIEGFASDRFMLKFSQLRKDNRENQ